MSQRKSQPPPADRETGTVGRGSLAKHQRNRAPRVKTQGQCSGHEGCLAGRCGHPRNLQQRAKGIR